MVSTQNLRRSFSIGASYLKSLNPKGYLEIKEKSKIVHFALFYIIGMISRTSMLAFGII